MFKKIFPLCSLWSYSMTHVSHSDIVIPSCVHTLCALNVFACTGAQFFHVVV